MNIVSLLIIVVHLLLVTPHAFAGGAVAAVKQRQLMEQQAIEQEIIRRRQEEMVRQYMIAYQQAAIQQYVQAQKQAIAMRAAQEQAAAQYMAQQMAQEIAAYQMAVARRNQILSQQVQLQIRVAQTAQYQQALMAHQARAYVQQAAAAQMVAAQQQKTFAEYQQALMTKEIVDRAAYEQLQQMQMVKTAQQVAQAQQLMAYQAASVMNQQDRLYENIPSTYVKDVVSVGELWASLNKSSKAWPLLIDNKAKAVTVAHYIQELTKQGGTIQKDPMHYVKMIDAMSKEDPSMLLQPFVEVLRIVAIIEYDYNNGIDKDVLAKRIFPTEQSFQTNKKRLGL